MEIADLSNYGNEAAKDVPRKPAALLEVNNKFNLYFSFKLAPNSVKRTLIIKIKPSS